MRNRELIFKKLEQLDSNFTNMEFLIKRQGSSEDFINFINKSRDLTEQLKSTINQEPI